jgi:hypothetical protein
MVAEDGMLRSGGAWMPERVDAGILVGRNPEEAPWT